MSTIITQNELVRKAVKWITEQQQEEGKKLSTLMDEAAMRFNLGPKDEEFLKRFFKKEQQ